LTVTAASSNVYTNTVSAASFRSIGGPQTAWANESQMDILARKLAWVGQYKFYRPFLLPPKTPTKQLDILRTAFKRTIMDQKFRALAKKMRLDLGYVSGEAAQKHVNDTLSISSSVQKKLRPLIFR